MKEIISTEVIQKFLKIKAKQYYDYGETDFLEKEDKEVIINVNDISNFEGKLHFLNLRNNQTFQITDIDSVQRLNNFLNNNLI